MAIQQAYASYNVCVGLNHDTKLNRKEQMDISLNHHGPRSSLNSPPIGA